MKNGCLLLFSFFVMNCLLAQDCPFIRVEGRVVDTLHPQSFYNLLVINRTTSSGVIGSPDGTFSIDAQEGDTISLSTSGYKSASFIVKNYNCKQKKTIVLSLISYQSQTVVVKPLKTLDEIKEERNDLSLTQTRKLKGVAAFMSPISALYERFSKKGKAKAKLAELQHQDNINNVVKELLKLYVSYDVVELDESEFADFINFMHISEGFLRTASDYELITYIKAKLSQYRSLNDYYFQKEDE